jgi:hypothetical protein
LVWPGFRFKAGGGVDKSAPHEKRSEKAGREIAGYIDTKFILKVLNTFKELQNNISLLES